MLLRKYQAICGLMVNVRRSNNSWRMEINWNKSLRNCIKIKIQKISKYSNKEVQIIKSDINSNNNNKHKYKSKVIKATHNRSNNHKHKHITD